VKTIFFCARLEGGGLDDAEWGRLEIETMYKREEVNVIFFTHTCIKSIDGLDFRPDIQLFYRISGPSLIRN
jgi:hypothetical protein